MEFRKILILPSNKISDVHLRSRAELLSILLICRQATILGLLATLAIFDFKTSDQVIPVLIGASVLNFLAYLFSRGKFYQTGVAIIIIEPMIDITMGVVGAPTLTSVLAGPVWLGLGPLISSLVLSSRLTAITIAATIVPFAIIATHIPPELRGSLYVEFIFTIGISLLALIGAKMRDRADRALELERSKSQQISKLTAIGEIAGGIAHEINTPLSLIQLRAEYMLESLSDGSMDKEAFSHGLISVNDTVKRIANIIQSLRFFARDAEGDPVELYSISKIVEDTLSLCQERFNNHEVQINFSRSHDVKISCRPAELSQALLNLLNNSFDAVQNLPEKWIRIKLAVREGYIRLSIIDSGKGIPSATQEKMMQPFFTTKEVGQGMGIGLSISMGIIKSHGGILQVDNSRTNTTIFIQLPIQTSNQMGMSQG